MAIKGDIHRYGGIAIGFHWIAAAVVPLLILLGLAAANVGDPAREAVLLRVHVVLGIAVLTLTLLRALWWSMDRRPATEEQPVWQRRLARAVHVLLYVAPIVAGTSGIVLLILSKAGGTLFLGALRPLPQFKDFPPMAVHAIAAFSLIALIGLHVGAALYHQFYRKDQLLARMGIGKSIATSSTPCMESNGNPAATTAKPDDI